MKSVETILQWDKLRRSLTKQCRTRGTQVSQGITKNTLDLGLITHSLMWQGEPSSQTLKLALPKCSSFKPLPAFQSLFLALEQDLCFLTKTPGPKEKLPRPRPQAVTGSEKPVPGFKKELCHSPYMRTSGKAMLDLLNTTVFFFPKGVIRCLAHVAELHLSQ